MVTIFSIPKPFEGRAAISQRNAVRSWMRIAQAGDIILFGKDKGVAECAASCGVKHYPDIQTNEFGTPLISAAFSAARQIARNPVIIYTNADIILFPDAIRALESVQLNEFIIVGRRRDLDLEEEIRFDDAGWSGRIMREAALRGKLHGYSGIDYMVFKKDLALTMPSFAVGRQGWDNWVLWDLKQKGVPIIDATEMITAVHQNHDFKHSLYGQRVRVGGPETIRNYKLAGGFKRMISIREADWLLTRHGLKRPPFMRRLFSYFAKYELWQFLLSVKRKFQSL